MDARDPLWMSTQVKALVADADVGGLIRLARQSLGWRQADLGCRLGYSAATISRLESGRRAMTDLGTLRKAWEILGIPAHLLGAAMGLGSAPVATVAGLTRSREGESVRRREFVAAAAGLAVPLLARLDEALAVLPATTRSATAASVDARLGRARGQFDRGDLDGLFGGLPELLGAAHEVADRSQEPGAYARAAACYDLATHSLVKVGRYAASRITADRAGRFAAQSGSALADAAASRSLSVVLRHERNPALADRVAVEAAGRLEAAGLTSAAHTGAYVQMLCTCGYNAAHAGDRERALELIAEAERAAGWRPDTARAGGVSAAQVALYRVGIHWSLGDAGAALRVGTRLHPGQFGTAERRARLHTDLARAWWLRGDPEQTARSLLAAHRESPAEIRDRPSIRGIATNLVRQHPRVPGVARLSASSSARR